MFLKVKSLRDVVRPVFYKLGETIGYHPKKFLIAPLLLTCVLILGFLNWELETYMLYKFVPTTGFSYEEKRQLDKYFPSNESGMFSISRKRDFGYFSRIIGRAYDESNILRNNIWDELITLDSIIRNISIQHENKIYKFQDLCSKWGDECIANDILELKSLFGSQKQISYPVAYDPETYHVHATGHFLGGVELSSDKFNIKSAKAVFLWYFLANGEHPSEEPKIIKWEQEMIRVLSTVKFKNLEFFPFTTSGYTIEFNAGVLSKLYYLAFSLIFVGIYAALSLSMKDGVRSKPWLSIAGSIGGVTATIASFGFLTFMGIKLSAIAVLVPTFIIGIGIDDCFILIAAWRRTNIQDSVPKRMGDTYAEASVSITITTLTDAFSFYTGIFSPVPIVQTVCLMAGTSIMFVYVYQLCFFGACLALSGFQEEESKHGLFFCFRAIPETSDTKSTLKSKILAGGTITKFKTPQTIENTQMAFFRDTLASFILSWKGKLIILTSYLIYICVSIYGIFHLKDILIINAFFPNTSYMYQYDIMETKYLPVYSPRIQILITSPLDYSNLTVQSQIESMLTEITSQPFITPEFTENWIESFTKWAKIYQEFEESIDISTKQGFINALQAYLKPNVESYYDIVFNENSTEIIASRFIVQVKGLETKTKDMITATKCVREVVASQKNFEAYSYTFWHAMTDESQMIKDVSIQLIVIAGAVVFIILILFIPDLIVAGCVLFAIISTELGIVGMMSLSGISLDPCSLIVLLMGIGGSVDFSAHVSYAFVNSEESSVEDKLRNTLHAVGLPVLQGALSTMICVFPLYFVNNNTYFVTAHIVELLMVISVLHALILLPIILQFLTGGKVFRKTTGSYKFT